MARITSRAVTRSRTTIVSSHSTVLVKLEILVVLEILAVLVILVAKKKTPPVEQLQTVV